MYSVKTNSHIFYTAKINSATSPTSFGFWDLSPRTCCGARLSACYLQKRLFLNSSKSTPSCGVAGGLPLFRPAVTTPSPRFVLCGVISVISVISSSLFAAVASGSGSCLVAPIRVRTIKPLLIRKLLRRKTKMLAKKAPWNCRKTKSENWTMNNQNISNDLLTLVNIVNWFQEIVGKDLKKKAANIYKAAPSSAGGGGSWASEPSNTAGSPHAGRGASGAAEQCCVQLLSDQHQGAADLQKAPTNSETHQHQ